VPSLPSRLIDAVVRPDHAVVLRLAWASLVANIAIVVTGGAVRLTGSGLGCPSWPRCTEASAQEPGSFVPHAELGAHGVIEFGNRMLTFVLVAVAITTLVAAWRLRPARRSLRRLALLLALGIPAQALIGGVTVLTDLNPWIVAGHLLVSMALISLAVVMIRRVGEGDGPALQVLARPGVVLVRMTYVLTWIVLYLGTVVTGSGPHAGDADAPRNGLDPQAMSQLHADGVFLLVGLTVGCLAVARAVGAPAAVVRAAAVLLAVELVQGTIGFVQYVTDLPEALVAAHLLGAAVLVAAATDLLVHTHTREAAQRSSGSIAARTNSSAR
jgi:cytochrome c oxidase assembly protein subunit 15